MTQAWVVVQWYEYDQAAPLAVFATHEEAEAYNRTHPPEKGKHNEIVGPVPFGLAAMVAA